MWHVLMRLVWIIFVHCVGCVLAHVCVCILCKLFDNVANYTCAPRAVLRKPAAAARISGGDGGVLSAKTTLDAAAVRVGLICRYTHARTKAQNMTRNSAQGSRHFQFAASPSHQTNLSVCAHRRKRNKNISALSAFPSRIRWWRRLIRCRFRRQRTRF